MSIKALWRVSLVLLLLWGVTSCQNCAIDPYDRTDCGYGNENTCVANGCCWNPTWAGGPAWCFFPGTATPTLPYKDSYVHLFEWRWTDIALECEAFLGPNGYDGVQVSPPNEHIVTYANGEAPWWDRYQAVSYILISRGGTREQFQDMVTRCNRVGVEIYADAVINHMTSLISGSATGYAGSRVGYYDYPNYKFQDFHHSPDYQGQGNCQINQGDYQNNAWRVRHCDLSSLVDLDTDAPYVQQTLGKYLQDLVNIGVKGFRIDAAKHMEPSHLAGIYKYVNTSFIYQEVIDLRTEAVKYTEYLGLGNLAEFLYGSRLADTFRNGKLSSLSNFGEAWGLMPSGKANAFLENHDNERGHGAGGNVLTYKDGKLYELGNVFMLGWPYGYAQVMSSYYIRNTDHAGPAQNVWQNGRNTCFDSNSPWVCQHRWQSIAGMVKFRKATRGEAVTNWWSNGGNQIAFGRGSKGFVVINRESSALTNKLPTSLPSGSYCDVIHSTNSTCVPISVTSGFVQVTVGAMDAIAIHV